jgi:sodium-dependent phosphate transporter
MLDYLWVVVAGGIAAFTTAMGIGANDVGNAFASSIGSKALTVKSAVAIASVFECAGAILMGSHVTKTIRKGIADYECFEDTPELFIYGCFCVLVSVGGWLFLASYLEMPVSTTHSCVGGMIGMTIITSGPECVIWYQAIDSFPWIGGVSGIVISWFISPIFSAFISGFIFYITRLTVLRREHSFDKSYYLMPVLIGFTVMLNTFFIIYKGGKGIGLDDLSAVTSLIIALSIGSFSGLILIPFIPRMKERVNRICDNRNLENERTICIEQLTIDDNNDNDNDNGKKSSCIKNIKNNLNYDVDLIKKDDKVKKIHDNAEKFNEKTEESFKYLQIFTAICDSFSHGANDVANAIGPYAAIVSVYLNDGEMNHEITMDEYAYSILALGGVGISLGLFLYGYKIIKAIGVKLCCITPSRGFSIELGSAVVVIIGSRFGIPLSTTHCQVGATIGVASLENMKTCSGINWSIAYKVFFGWMITLIVVGGTTALLIAQGIYAPSKYLDECSIIHNLTDSSDGL